MTTACMIVIGHVDHGKTALVRALTGIETDRLTQEKQRGLSITLGFAHCRLPSGTLDLIDAPGHEDFIRAMVSGATGARGAMLVVSAVDGVAPQTVEHLRIAALLGVPVGLVAVTKADLVAHSALPERLRTITAALAELGVAGVPVIGCSTLKTGGVDALTAGLNTAMQALPRGASPTAAFLPIDRVFSLSGMGTVVTGTLLGGDLTLADAMALQPGARPVALRGVQARGQARDVVAPGERVAVNLRGIAVKDVARGDVLCSAVAFGASDCLDVRLSLLADATRPLKHMQDIRVLFGTSQAVATVRLMGGGQITPGCAGFAQLRFKHPVTAFAGQPAIIRSLSPAVTLGGACILDPQALPVKSSDAAHLAVMQAAWAQDMVHIANALCAKGRGVAQIEDVARISRQSSGHVQLALPEGFKQIDGGWIIPQSALEAVGADIRARLGGFHALHPIRQWAPQAILHDRAVADVVSDHVETRLIADGVMRRQNDRVALASHDAWACPTEAQRVQLDRIEGQIMQGGVTPPDVPTLFDAPDDADLLDLLIDKGRIIPMVNIGLNQRLVFHAEAVAQAARALAAAFPSPAGFTTSQARVALATTRKFIVPMLEHFDAQGITLRNGDIRQIAPPAQ